MKSISRIPTITLCMISFDKGLNTNEFRKAKTLTVWNKQGWILQLFAWSYCNIVNVIFQYKVKSLKFWGKETQITDAQNWKSRITYLNWLGLKAKMILFLEMEINNAWHAMATGLNDHKISLLETTLVDWAARFDLHSLNEKKFKW